MVLKNASFICLLLVAWVVNGHGAAGRDASSGPIATATFAGGCFWCMEHHFDELDGVLSTTSGYTGGHKKVPTYAEVSRGGTGHTEAVQVRYDPKKIGYVKLLEVFWSNIYPFTANRQFCDAGSQYRPGIFYHDAEQKALSEKSQKALQGSGRFDVSIVVEIAQATEFYKAEKYHQDYYRKNPIRYAICRYSCGRDRRLKEIWGEHQG
jgi:peptide-methionine (S)-S-oxide reductase